MNNIWHFRRPQLAATYIANLFDHGISRIVLFGRRRIGKTAFILNDLAECADSKGIHTLYCCFWENKDSPQQCFGRAIDNFKVCEVKTKVRAGLKFGVDFGVEVEVANRPQQAGPDEIRNILQAFDKWVNKLNGQPCIVVLDEIQHLATSSKFEPFAAALRTMLDIAPTNIKVVFTGSSLGDLKRLFNDSKAPFFSFANEVSFPLLGDDYLQFLADTYSRITSKQLSLDLLATIYSETGFNALATTGAVQALIMNPDADLAAIWDELQEKMMQDDGVCQNEWTTLSLPCRVVYLLLMQEREPFAETSLELFAQKGFSRGMGQKALQTLLNRGLISKESHGEYRRVIPKLDEWLRNRGETPEQQEKTALPSRV